MSDIQTLFARTPYTHPLGEAITDYFQRTKAVVTDPANRKVALTMLAAKAVCIVAAAHGLSKHNYVESAVGTIGQQVFGITSIPPVLALHVAIKTRRRRLLKHAIAPKA